MKTVTRTSPSTSDEQAAVRDRQRVGDERGADLEYGDREADRHGEGGEQARADLGRLSFARLLLAAAYWAER